MKLKTFFSLSNLHCTTPTDPSGEDEPYLWVYYIKTDGSNVRQRLNDPAHLSANITVLSGSGRPGNLDESSVTSNGNIHIPPTLGTFSDHIEPIILTFVRAGKAVRLFIPGRIVAICIAIDEDSSPRNIMEGAFHDTKNLIQNRINDFINALDLNGMANIAFATNNPANSMLTQFNQQLAQFINNLQGEATAAAFQDAEISVLAESDWWNPSDYVAMADPDELIGNTHFISSEKEIIDNNLDIKLHADLRQSASGLGGAWYFVDGFINATALFTSPDLVLKNPPVISKPKGKPEEYIFKRNHLCVGAGTKITITKYGNSETYQTSVEYPFFNYRYTLDGQVINGDSGIIQISKEVNIPEFDEDRISTIRPFIKFHKETRQVKIQFEKKRLPNDPQIEQLFLTNDPTDGNYDLELKIEAVLNNGNLIPVGVESIFFDGITIQLPDEFMRFFRECMKNFVGTKWSKSKRVTPKDLWSPMERILLFEEIVKELDSLAEVGAFEKQSIVVAKNIIAGKLNILRH